MALLHACLSIVFVVEHHNGRVWRLDCADGCQCPHTHEGLAIAGDDDGVQFRLGQRDPQIHHRSTSHCAPEIVIPVGRAHRRYILRRIFQNAVKWNKPFRPVSINSEKLT